MTMIPYICNLPHCQRSKNLTMANVTLEFAQVDRFGNDKFGFRLWLWSKSSLFDLGYYRISTPVAELQKVARDEKVSFGMATLHFYILRANLNRKFVQAHMLTELLYFYIDGTFLLYCYTQN